MTSQAELPKQPEVPEKWKAHSMDVTSTCQPIIQFIHFFIGFILALAGHVEYATLRKGRATNDPTRLTAAHYTGNSAAIAIYYDY